MSGCEDLYEQCSEKFKHVLEVDKVINIFVRITKYFPGEENLRLPKGPDSAALLAGQGGGEAGAGVLHEQRHGHQHLEHGGDDTYLILDTSCDNIQRRIRGIIACLYEGAPAGDVHSKLLQAAGLFQEESHVRRCQSKVILLYSQSFIIVRFLDNRIQIQ